MKTIKQSHLKIILVLNLFFLFLVLFSGSVFAQFQEVPFSGNDAGSYQCIEIGGGGVTDLTEVRGLPAEEIEIDPILGYYTCPGGYLPQAVLKPPTIQQIEIWFFRIVYVIWALVGVLSFFMLAVLGYRYMITRGDVTKITEIRQKIIYYMIGFALVFLAVPILTTIFSLLQINDDVTCYDVDMPGFRFFFPELCTDPQGVFADECRQLNPSSAQVNQLTGIACGEEGKNVRCSIDGGGGTANRSVLVVDMTCDNSVYRVTNRRTLSL